MKYFPLFTCHAQQKFSRHSNKNDTGRNFYQHKITYDIRSDDDVVGFNVCMSCRRIEFILYRTTLKHHSTVFASQSLELRAMVNMCVY